MNALAIVDANNFYASCERLFDARLVGRPVVVLSNNDGCVIARSQEAKACGVKMGVPLFQIRHLIDIHGIEVYSSNYVLYGDMSARLMEVLGRFTPRIETYSIDEAFLDLSGIPAPELACYGHAIRDEVEQLTGLPVSLGIAATKTLAKLANYHAKRSAKAQSVVDLYHSPHLETALQRTPVEEIWGIGPAYARLLQAHGFATAYDLRAADDAWVKRHLTIVGLRTVRELRGEPCVPLESVAPPRKTVTVSRTFGQAVESLADIRDAVQWYITRAAEKLRRHKLAAGVLTVFVMTDRFRQELPQYSNAATVELAQPTDTTTELWQRARLGLERIYRPGFSYRRAGVTLSGLLPRDQLTLPLYDQDQWQQSQRLAATIDRINQRWGRDTVRYGLRKSKSQEWRTKAALRSPRYTTHWPELFTVAAGKLST